jgi:general secretion pathway protein G
MKNILSLKRSFMKQNAFSILEIIIVLGIIATLAVIIMTKLTGSRTQAQMKETTVRVQNIQQGLLQYQMDVGSYPTTAHGLNALVENPGGVNGWQGPYIDKDSLVDAWKQPFSYAITSEGIEITSNGPDGVAGTKDDIHYLNGKLVTTGEASTPHE